MFVVEKDCHLQVTVQICITQRQLSMKYCDSHQLPHWLSLITHSRIYGHLTRNTTFLLEQLFSLTYIMSHTTQRCSKVPMNSTPRDFWTRKTNLQSMIITSRLV